MHGVETSGAESAEDLKGLDRLTRGRAQESLAGLLGEDRAREVWQSVCRDLDVDPESPLSLEKIEAVAERLMEFDGPVSLVGSSLSIRVRTYIMLEGANRLDSFLQSHEEEPAA